MTFHFTVSAAESRQYEKRAGAKVFTASNCE